MRMTLLQTDIVWADPDANIRQAEALLRQHAGSDVYVLPEMWATGFATEPEGIAQSESACAALRWMQKIAREYDCAVAGSLAVQTADGHYRNRHYFCCPEDTTWYDKHHLFTYGHEDRFYTAGDKRVVVTWRGCRFRLATCYDLRFPLWTRYTEEQPFDVIICVANWPQSRQTAWEVLTRARAVENQSYLVAVNRTGDDSYSHYVGESRVVDARGTILGQCDADTVQALTVVLALEALLSARRRFRVLDDSDPFILPARRQ